MSAVAHAPGPRRGSLATLACLALALVALGWFAIYLNKVYYRAHGPFYDSLSYMNFMAQIMDQVRREGFLAGARIGVSNSTVFLPWLESAVLGLFLEPKRTNAVLLQLPLVIVQVAAAYAYFRRVAAYARPVAVAFSLLTVCFAGVFFFNGGLSDLRMDLAQALTFGAAAALLCVARRTGQLAHWLLFGAVLAIGLLFRATSAVYVVLLVGIAGLVDLVRPVTKRSRCLRNYLAAGLVAAVLAGWFYIVNFALLVDYYTVRNYDAMARLPISESIKHLGFVFRMHMGWPLCALAAAVFAVEVVSRARARLPLLRCLNWPMLLAGVAPVAFLVLFGTSPGNPFVSLVSVPGLLMFLLAPYAGPQPIGSPRWEQGKRLVLIAATVLVVVLAARAGLRSHREVVDPFTPDAAALRQITGAIDRDLAARNRKDAAFEVTYVGSLDSLVILNSLVFDQHFALPGGINASKNGLQLVAVQPALANPVDWKQIPGERPEDKLKTLTAEAVAKVDYLIVPEDGNTFIEHHPINPHALAYRDMLLAAGGMTRIAGPIRVSRMESVSVYRNDNRK